MRTLAFAFLLLLAACGDDPVESLPLAITVTADRTTVAAGDTVRFEIRAQGGSLLGVQINYGDTAVDDLQTFGARTARTTFRHAYASTGVYTVEAAVADAFDGEKRATLTIQVR